MKSKIPFQFRISFASTLCCAAVMSHFTATSASAGTLYWDGNATGAIGNPPTSGVGGAGAWEPAADATPNWWNGTTYQLWNGAGGQDVADFRGAGGAVTLGGNVAATKLNFLATTAVSLTTTGFTIDLGSTGVIDFNDSVNHVLTTPLKGSITLNATGSTRSLATSSHAFINGNNVDLTSTVVNLAGNANPIVLNNAGALGAAGADVKVTKGLILLGNTIAAPISYNAWDLELNGGILRARFGISTINGPVTLTANSSLMTRDVADAGQAPKLVFSNTATVDLGANTLFIHSATLSAGVELNGVISGAGGLTQETSLLASAGNGAGTTTLNAINTYTGATLVSAGTLNIAGSLTSAINVSNNATLGGEGSTTGNVVMSNGSTLTFDPTTTGANQYFRTTGTIDATAGGVKLKLSSAVTSGTGIVIAQADGGWGPSTNANFTLLSRGTAYLSGNQLLYDFAAANLTWKGDAANPTFWDLATTQNWDNTGSPDVFFSGDNVTFGDSATTKVVAVQAALAAGPLTFTNTFGNDYSLSGAALSATSLAKSGSGKVTVSNAVTLSGAATITTGTLQLGDGTNATGSLSSAITNDGALITSFGANNVTVANAISGTGSLTKEGAGKVTFTGAQTANGNTVINGGTLAFSNTGLAVSGANLDTVISGAGSVEKVGVGLLTVDTANSYSGSTAIAAGSVVLSGSGALGDTTLGTTVTTGASLALAAGGTFGTGETLTISGAGVTVADHFATGSFGSRGALQSSSGSNTYAGNIELGANGTTRIGTQNSASLTLTGAITQASGITTANILFRLGDSSGDFVTLSNAGNSFGGDSTIFTSLAVGVGNYAGVRLGISNALPTNRTISGGSGSGTGTALDLAGFDQSLNGLITGAGSTSLRIINTNTGTPSTLTLNPTADRSSSNTTILGGDGLGVINVVKDGTFSQTITGANSYTGNTTVTAGTLSLGTANASNEKSTVTIAAGAFLNLNYAGTDTVNKLFIGATQLAAGVYGNSSSVLPVIANSQITGTGTLTVTSGPTVAGYAAWINGFFPGETNLAIIGADADPDNDGIDNSVEMVIGGNPATGMDTALLPTLELVTNPGGGVPAGNYLLFTYRRSDLSVAGSVTSACETDTDLVGPWTAAIDGASGVVIQVDDNFTFTPPAAAATDRVRVYVPRGANTKLFGRLDVVVP